MPLCDIVNKVLRMKDLKVRLPGKNLNWPDNLENFFGMLFKCDGWSYNASIFLITKQVFL